MKQRFIFGLAALLIAGIAVAITLSRAPTNHVAVVSPSPSPVHPQPEAPTLDVRDYNVARLKIENQRLALWSRYQRATSQAEQLSIINEARETLVRSVSDQIVPYWYGTSWDFYGTTETPRQGKIACGYFVSTVLRDTGMKVQRAKLAQQASENIILSLTTDEHTKRFSQLPIKSFVDASKKWGSGLYVVGLDVHVGFILNIDGDVFFIHSSYVEPYAVVKERAINSQVLASSRYRVLGKLSEDNELILRWLRGDEIVTRTS